MTHFVTQIKGHTVAVTGPDAERVVEAKHGWSPDSVARLQRLHKAFHTLKF